MKIPAISIIFGSLLYALSVCVAIGEPSKASQVPHRSSVKPKTAIGVKTIKQSDADEAVKENNGRWNGSYLGVNAGTNFGATAGKNILIPLGENKD